MRNTIHFTLATAVQTVISIHEYLHSKFYKQLEKLSLVITFLLKCKRFCVGMSFNSCVRPLKTVLFKLLSNHLCRLHFEVFFVCLNEIWVVCLKYKTFINAKRNTHQHQSSQKSFIWWAQGSNTGSCNRQIGTLFTRILSLLRYLDEWNNHVHSVAVDFSAILVFAELLDDRLGNQLMIQSNHCLQEHHDYSFLLMFQHFLFDSALAIN